MYWVVAGLMCVRQQILGLREERKEDGTPGCAILLDSALVPVETRSVKPFQGWRYLKAEDAPPDITAAAARGTGELPEALKRELRALSLL